MEYKYKKALIEYKLSEKDLTEDAIVGISNIKEIERAMNMLTKKGLSPSQKTLKKLSAMDKWVYYEILDIVHDTNKNDDEIPFEADEVIDEIKNGNNGDKKEVELSEEEKKGNQIEAELKKLMESNKFSYTIDELKNVAPITYEEIWDNYDDGEENGVGTKSFSIKEDSNNLFNVSKN
jgi:hypothetical protein